MKKLQELVSKAKGSVSLFINDNRDYYASIEEYIEPQERKEIEEEVWNKMIELDTCVKLIVYPNTPIGFFIIYHYDIETALDIALATFKF